MSRHYRCWFEDQPEPTEYPVEANSALTAAVSFINDDDDKDTDDLEKSPVLVLVRGSDAGTGIENPVERIRVTASTEVTLWAYPDDAA